MGDAGTIGFFDGEGSLHSNSMGVGALGTGSDYAGTMTINYGNDVDSKQTFNITPADVCHLVFPQKLVTCRT